LNSQQTFKNKYFFKKKHRQTNNIAQLLHRM